MNWKGDPLDSRSQQAEGPQATALNPPPAQLHRARRRPGHRPRPGPEGPAQGQRPRVKAKTPSDEGGMLCPRWDSNWTPAPRIRRSPANIANPAQSGHTTRSETQGMHIVHTLYVAHFDPQPGCLNGCPGGAVVSCARFCSDMKSTPPEPDPPGQAPLFGAALIL